MQYVMSDIHGDLAHFRRMLKKIGFLPPDKLYILGDVLDKGCEHLRMLTFVRENPNMLLIKGNHEYLCERYLAGTVSGELWDKCGGGGTRREVDLLSREEKEELLDYLRGLPVYWKVEAAGQEYFLTHSGYHADFPVLCPDKIRVDIEASVRAAVESDQERYLFSDDIHYIPAGLCFDKKIIVGHYPTIFLEDYHQANIFHGKKYIDIDTGNECREEGGCLACLCLDSGREFYV